MYLQVSTSASSFFSFLLLGSVSTAAAAASLQELLELLECPPSVRDAIFDALVHLSIPKVCRASRLHNPALCAACEDLRWLARTSTVGKCAQSICRFVFKSVEHPIQPVMAELFKEPLDIRTRQPLHRVVAQAGVLDQDSLACLHLSSSQSAFLGRDLVWLALQLRQVDFLRADRKALA